MVKLIFCFALMLILLNCGLMTTSTENESEVTVVTCAETHFNLDDGIFFVGNVYPLAFTDLFSEEFEYVSFLKVTTNNEIDVAYWESDCEFPDSLVKTTTVGRAPPEIFKDKEGQLLASLNCALDLYISEDQATCITDEMNFYGINETNDYYFFDSGQIVKRDNDDGKLTTIAELSFQTPKSMLVPDAGPVIIQEFLNDDIETSLFYLIYEDGTVHTVSDGDLLADDFYINSDSRYFVLGTRSNDDTSGLYEVVVDSESKTETISQILNADAFTVDGLDDLTSCSFIHNEDLTLLLVCSTGLVLDPLGTASFLALDGVIDTSVASVRNGFAYLLLTVEDEDDSGVADLTFLKGANSVHAVDQSLMTSEDETASSLVRVSLDNGSIENLWSTGDYDILSITGLRVTAEDKIYFLGTCPNREDEESGDPWGCVGYYDPENDADGFQIIFSDVSLESSRQLSYWEY